jgi:hypothetical protein
MKCIPRCFFLRLPQFDNPFLLPCANLPSPCLPGSVWMNEWMKASGVASHEWQVVCATMSRQIALVMREERIMETKSSSADGVCRDIYRNRGRKEQFRISRNKLLSCLLFARGVRSHLSVHFLCFFQSVHSCIWWYIWKFGVNGNKFKLIIKIFDPWLISKVCVESKVSVLY